MNIVSVDVTVAPAPIYSKPYVEGKAFTDVNTNSKIKKLEVRLEEERGQAIIFVTRFLDRRRVKRFRSYRVALFYIGNIDEHCRADAQRQVLEKLNEIDYSAPKVRPYP